MTKDSEIEFSTVDAVLKTGAPTAHVDAFSLALIKAERQMRRLFTHVVYQSVSFNFESIDGIKELVGADKQLYFEHFERGLDKICTRSAADLVGQNYDKLRNRLKEAKGYRNKIFHGQLTTLNLNSRQLEAMHKDIRSWCTLLAGGAQDFLGYDGFSDSFLKKNRDNVLKESIDNLEIVKSILSSAKNKESGK